MIASSRTYAIGMVHFQIAGGLRMLTSLVVIYVLSVGCAAGLYSYYDLATRVPLANVISFLLAIEGLALLAYGGIRVSIAVRTDISSRMIESHRLMPVPAWRALIGYIFGSTTPALVFFALNVLFTSILAVHDGISLTRLMLNHFIILGFAVFIWSIAALGTFIYRNIFFVVLALVFFGFVTRLLFLMYVAFPGFALLLTPFIGDTAFAFGTVDPDWTFFAGLIGQAALFAIFFGAACRRYRGTYPTTFSVVLGTLFLGVWAGICAVGMRDGEQFASSILQMLMFGRMRRGPIMPASDPRIAVAQIVCALVSCALVAAIPLWSLIQQQKRSTLIQKATPWLILLIAVLCAIPSLGAGERCTNITFLRSAAVLACHVLTAYLGMKLASHLQGKQIALLLTSTLILLWIGPLILEAIVYFITNRANTYAGLGLISTFSPLGALVDIWLPGEQPNLVPGLLWQALVPLALLIAHITFRRPSQRELAL